MQVGKDTLQDLKNILSHSLAVGKEKYFEDATLRDMMRILKSHVHLETKAALLLILLKKRRNEKQSAQSQLAEVCQKLDPKTRNSLLALASSPVYGITLQKCNEIEIQSGERGMKVLSNFKDELMKYASTPVNREIIQLTLLKAWRALQMPVSNSNHEKLLSFLANFSLDHIETTCNQLPLTADRKNCRETLTFLKLNIYKL